MPGQRPRQSLHRHAKSKDLNALPSRHRIPKVNRPIPSPRGQHIPTRFVGERRDPLLMPRKLNRSSARRSFP